MVCIALYCFICRGRVQPKRRISQISILTALFPIMTKWKSKKLDSFWGLSNKTDQPAVDQKESPGSLVKKGTDRAPSGDSLAPPSVARASSTEEYSYMTIHGDTLTQLTYAGSTMNPARVYQPDTRYSSITCQTTSSPSSPMENLVNMGASNQSILFKPQFGGRGSSQFSRQKPAIAGGSTSLPTLATPESSASTAGRASTSRKGSPNGKSIRKSTGLLPVLGFRKQPDNRSLRNRSEDSTAASRRFRKGSSDNNSIISLSSVVTPSDDPNRVDSKVLMNRPKWSNASEPSLQKRRVPPFGQLIRRLGDFTFSDNQSGRTSDQGESAKDPIGRRVGLSKVLQNNSTRASGAMGSYSKPRIDGKAGISVTSAESISMYDTKELGESREHFDL